MSLLQMSLTGGVMIIVAALIRRLAIDRLPKGTFLLLWALAALRLLVPVSLPSPASVYSLIPQQQISSEIETAPMQPANIPEFDTVKPSDEISEGPSGSIVSAAEPEVSSFPFWTVIWLTGTAAAAVWFLAAYVRCLRRFRESLPVENEYAIQWLPHHKLRRPFTIRQTDQIASPLTYGIFRPVILLPSTMNWQDTEQLDYVLYHEWTHIRRFDNLSKLVLALTLCVHWFNPLVWGMYLMANQDIELSCDELVVRRFSQKEDIRANYAMTLISMEEQRTDSSLLYGCFSANSLEKRVRSIMKTRKATGLVILGALALVVCVACVFGTTAQPRVSDGIQDDTARFVIYRYENVFTYSDDDPDLSVELTRYEFAAGSPEFETVKDILSGYRYHPGLCTLKAAAEELMGYGISLGSQPEGYRLDVSWDAIDSFGGWFICGGNGTIYYNDTIYSMDMFGSQNSLSMLRELNEFLLTCQPMEVSGETADMLYQKHDLERQISQLQENLDNELYQEGSEAWIAASHDLERLQEQLEKVRFQEEIQTKYGEYGLSYDPEQDILICDGVRTARVRIQHSDGTEETLWQDELGSAIVLIQELDKDGEQINFFVNDPTAEGAIYLPKDG